MQAVILAAGKSTRTYPLTITKPKPLLKIANKSLLEHNLENLSGIVDEAIIVVGYKKNLIKKYFGSKYKNIKIKYVEQKEQLGTGHAALLAEHFIKDKFILMAGDDIYSKKDIRNCIKHRYSILVKKTKNWKNFGVVVERNGILLDFVEKPEKFVSDLINTAFYVLDKKIFHYLHKIKKSKRNEYEFPDALKLLSNNKEINCIRAIQWLPIVYAWDLLKADRALRKGRNSIEHNARINGVVKNSSIGNGCIIEGNVKNSIVMDGAIIDNNSIVEDSIIGENVHFSGKIQAKSNVYSAIKDKKIKVERLGAIIGDDCELANVDLKAGCKIWPNKRISNKIIKRDIM